MNEQHAPNTPFKTLGTHLRYLREQSEETTAEVSGAVEIDEQQLLQIESGFERPSEDILLLLISHFDLQEQTAVQLWQLAGYDGSPETVRLSQDPETQQLGQAKAVVMLALDARIIYSDSFDVACNTAGVTLNFSQQSGLDDQKNVVSRLGMSYEQAEQVVRDLQRALLNAEYSKGPKTLPPGDVV